MFEAELVRFIADDGMGIADELLFTGANVCVRGQKVRREVATRWEAAREKNSPGGGPRTCPTLGPWLCCLVAMLLGAQYCCFVVPKRINTVVFRGCDAVGLSRYCVDAPAAACLLLCTGLLPR